MKVIGIRKVEFDAQDGKHVRGVTLYCSYPITKNGEGVGVEKLFLSDAKLGYCGYEPALYDEINVQYNRFGKVEYVTSVG